LSSPATLVDTLQLSARRQTASPSASNKQQRCLHLLVDARGASRSDFSCRAMIGQCALSGLSVTAAGGCEAGPACSSPAGGHAAHTCLVPEHLDLALVDVASHVHAAERLSCGGAMCPFFALDAARRSHACNLHATLSICSPSRAAAAARSHHVRGPFPRPRSMRYLVSRFDSPTYCRKVIDSGGASAHQTQVLQQPFLGATTTSLTPPTLTLNATAGSKRAGSTAQQQDLAHNNHTRADHGGMALPSVEHFVSCHPGSILHKCSRILYVPQMFHRSKSHR
jgi:hypothetical protein